MSFFTDGILRAERRFASLSKPILVLALVFIWAGTVRARQSDDLKPGSTGTVRAERSAETTKETPAGAKVGPPAKVADPAELARALTELEARIHELEAKLAKLTEATPKDAAKAEEVTALKREVATLQEDAKKDAGFLNFFRGTEISGTVDGYYGYNFNHPDKDFNIGRNFDFYHSNFNLNYLELVFEKKNDLNDRLGYRFDLGFGPTADWVHSVDPAGGEVVKHFQQAYLSYVAPVGSGLTIDFGKFVTQHGAEVIETKDNFNYSRSFLFAYAIPYYHTGLRVKYTFNPKITGVFYVVNGWNNFLDNNGGKTLGFQVVLNPTSRLSIIQNYMVGPEQPADNTHWRHLSDTLVTYQASSKLTLMGNFDYGRDRLSDGRGVHWMGFAGYFRYAFTDKFSIAPRYEVFDDHDGFTTGLTQTLQSFTLTPEFKLANNLLARFEFRRDFSDENFFSKSRGRLVGSQNSLLLGLTYFFSSRGQ